VVDESALAVDLHDGEPLPVPRLELGIAFDVDLDELERNVLPDLRDDPPRPLAQTAGNGVVDDDLTDRCRG
jgi:hypothetical protein